MPRRKAYDTPDAENPEWSAEDVATAKRGSEVFTPEFLKAARRGRGKQKAPTKRLVSIRLSPDVLEAYRRTGRGWQARIDADLKRSARRLAIREVNKHGRR